MTPCIGMWPLGTSGTGAMSNSRISFSRVSSLEPSSITTTSKSG